ncbi:MAG: VIT family protein [Acidobacteria bacterium]|nr:VIT family protein [Acidobacteriota bacterium]
MPAAEFHRNTRTGWLRAAVLGANDGLISTSSLVAGVAAAQSGRDAIFLASLAGLVAGALSMAAGEYVSVSSQADVEKADLDLERRGLETDPATELAELTRIYQDRGLSPELAAQVADQLTAGDALAAHARDELGILEISRARPVQAAVASALAFAAGAALPVVLAATAPRESLAGIVVGASLAMLFALGALAARLGGAPLLPGALRVGFWGLAAMVLTSLVGRLVSRHSMTSSRALRLDANVLIALATPKVHIVPATARVLAE